MRPQEQELAGCRSQRMALTSGQDSWVSLPVSEAGTGGDAAVILGMRFPMYSQLGIAP